MAGHDPQRGRGDQADCGDTAAFHDDFSPSARRSGVRLRSRCRATSMNTGISASGLEVRVERTPPPDAVGDDHQHVDRALDVGVLGNVAALGARC